MAALISKLCELTGQPAGTEVLASRMRTRSQPRAFGGGAATTYDQLSFMQRHALKKQSPELHRGMKNASVRASKSYPPPKPYNEMSFRSVPLSSADPSCTAS